MIEELKQLQGQTAGFEQEVTKAEKGVQDYEEAVQSLAAAQTSFNTLDGTKQKIDDDLSTEEGKTASLSSTASDATAAKQAAQTEVDEATKAKSDADAAVEAAEQAEKDTIAQGKKAIKEAKDEAALALKTFDTAVTAFQDQERQVREKRIQLESEVDAKQKNSNAVTLGRNAFDKQKDYTEQQKETYDLEKRIRDTALDAAKQAVGDAIVSAGEVQTRIELALVEEIKTFEKDALAPGGGLSLYWVDELTLRAEHGEVEASETTLQSWKDILDDKGDFPAYGGDRVLTDADYVAYVPTTLSEPSPLYKPSGPIPDPRIPEAAR